ncbi:MAG: M48 family metallopeptidase [Muribaculaceae bacterium]|nr:M48 family metallopeptidase [Muribaculaceae bacterium]
MKKIIFPALAGVLLSLTGCSIAQNMDMARLAQGGAKIAQSMTISNDEIQQYVKSYIAQSDAKNNVCGANDAYTVRLNKILSGITNVEGIPLNFKVYKTNDINAFACADGSIRVYSGLMDVMSDEEVLGVIGHEMGHVAHQDTKNAFKNALQTAALMDVIASTGSTAAALTDSQFGAIAQNLASAKYSKNQENNADDYGYSFLKKNGKNPAAMVKAFQKLKQMEDASGSTATGGMAQLFSTHPDINKRIARMQAKCKADGYSY